MSISVLSPVLASELLVVSDAPFPALVAAIEAASASSGKATLRKLFTA